MKTVYFNFSLGLLPPKFVNINPEQEKTAVEDYFLSENKVEDFTAPSKPIRYPKRKVNVRLGEKQPASEISRKWKVPSRKGRFGKVRSE